MKVFLDTNVLISALTTRGLCAGLVEKLLDEQIETIVSQLVLVELRRILVEKFAIDLDDTVYAREFLARLTIAGDADSPFTTQPSIPDPDDVPIIASALDAGSDLFVTGNKALLALNKLENMYIVSPRDAWLTLFGD